MILVPYTHESNINRDIEIFHIYCFHLTQLNQFCSFVHLELERIHGRLVLCSEGILCIRYFAQDAKFLHHASWIKLLKGSLFCMWLVLFAEEDEIGMEDLLRKGNKRDISLVKGTEYYPAKLFFDKEFL